MLAEPPGDEIALARGLVDNDRADDRLLHAAAARRTVGRQIISALPEFPDLVGNMAISASFHQFGNPFILVLFCQSSLVAKIAQDDPHCGQAPLRNSAPCAESN